MVISYIMEARTELSLNEDTGDGEYLKMWRSSPNSAYPAYTVGFITMTQHSILQDLPLLKDFNVVLTLMVPKVYSWRWYPSG